jgi:hypothetical protein
MAEEPADQRPDQRPDRQPDRQPDRHGRPLEPGRAAAAARARHQALWVEEQVRQAMARGEFDNLPGAGKPIEGLGQTHDPDWWVKRLIEREQISGVLPPALALRTEDAGLDATLDRETSERVVRELLEDFNRRVVDARRQLLGGPPVITRTRDVDAEVERWRQRRRARFDRGGGREGR